MFRKIRDLLTGKKPTLDDKIAAFCDIMAEISNELLRIFSDEKYKWEETKGVKTFECLVLSKFLLSHALLTTLSDKMDEVRIGLNLKMIDSVFKPLFEETFQGKMSPASSKETIDNRLLLYSEIIAEEPHPRCWQKIAGVCTGIDYDGQKDLYTLLSSSTILPQLLFDTQDIIKLIFKS